MPDGTDAHDSATRHRVEAAPRPESTYRLQFHAGFTFRDAAALAPYLRELGVTHVYASPYLKARPGSTHGYDIVDHRSLNPEIGTPDDHAAFLAALREHGLRLILDVVPNHMGVATNDNPWWDDVLENGPASRYGEFFDVAWKATARPELEDRVLLPVLGEPYGDVLESGQLRLAYDARGFAVHYYERRFPVAPRSYALILGPAVDELQRRLGAESTDLIEFQSILTAVGHLPDRSETDPAKVAERQREKEVVKRRLADLVARNEVVREVLDATVTKFHGTPGDPRSFDRLDDLLEHQCYRLSNWRVAADEINYRRFFDINDLAALRADREEVFAATHDLVFQLLADDVVTGLRVDHPDGLYDPAEYFHRLQRQYLVTRAGCDREAADAALAEVAASPAPRRWPLYVVAEKILGANEALPDGWAVDGTSGYEFTNAVNGLFVDPAAEPAFTRLYRDLTGDPRTIAEVVYQSKRLILTASLASELTTLARQLDRIAQKGRRSRDFTLTGLRDALREVIACFPVYRSYLTDAGPSDADRRAVEVAVRWAIRRNPLVSPAVFRFIRDTVLQPVPEGASDADRAERRRFAGAFQQVTSPVMAKGTEDTAFYVYNRLISLNEVGGEPAKFGTPPAALHKFLAERQAHWPYALSPLSTHDTKRSEDVRARINVLSEMPDEWAAAVRRWSELNAGLRPDADGTPVPDANEEYLLYQTLIGAWPTGCDRPDATFVERIQAYVLKALHEAKVHGSWVNPNAAYDAAAQEFVARILDPERGGAFLADFVPFQRDVARYGAINTLAQTLLKVASPGVPDTYQGTDLPDFSLVDPDNRRPVDYDHRRARLGELRGGVDLAALTQNVEDGRAKLFVTSRALHARKDHPGLFAEGEYLPVTAEGAKAEHVFAFVRRHRNTTALVAVPRLVRRLCGSPDRSPIGSEVWGDTRLSLPDGGAWRDVFTGDRVTASDGTVRAAEVFAAFPVALLFRDE